MISSQAETSRLTDGSAWSESWSHMAAANITFKALLAGSKPPFHQSWPLDP
jgi:hypothetical protein